MYKTHLLLRTPCSSLHLFSPYPAQWENLQCVYLVPDPMLSCSVVLFYVNWCLEYILGNVCDKIHVHCSLHLKAYGQGTFDINW